MPGTLVDRLLARLIDGVILAVVVWGVVSSVLSAVIIGGALGYRSSAYFVLGITLAVLGLVINLGYYAVLETRTGQTVGKMVMKLRVQGPDGALPTVEQSLRRNAFLAAGVVGTVASNILGIVPVIGGFLGGLVSLIAGLGALALVLYIAYTINEDETGRQGWHDRFAGGTQVLKEAVSPAQS
ncbi:RDD family protein [Nocardioides massiliensis]|uniref:RDD family membrane protein YckC n=1 Tax=Nocardioides massiliensis TaxID=1325935 RepID=A0ABT9NRQ8_9ACTN|nr:RDD family protein [Nocardioides massiliensis]MDP9823068.1 putative RDD family membrane protein YckC [Nocardioides massiliensis]